MTVLRGPLRGATWIVGSATHGCWIGTYEKTLQGVFKDIVRPGATVFDVGAHVGFYTLLGSRLAGDAGHVVAFEPDPRNACFLSRHVHLNGHTNVTLIPKAVSSVSGRHAFEPADNSFMGRLSAKGRLQVNVCSLDEVVCGGGLPPPDVIKIDVEGAEFDVLMGAFHVLSKFRPYLFVSTHGGVLKSACTDFLRSLGYEITDLGPDAGDTILASSASPYSRHPAFRQSRA